MNWPWQRKETISLDTLIQRLEAVHATISGESVTPENCMRSPTVNAIVTAISRRLAASPVHVLRKTSVRGKENKERLPDHPVQRLLNAPNQWQSKVDYWLDAVSAFIRYGRYYAFKARGNTGPIRRLVPISPAAIQVEQDDNYDVTFRGKLASGEHRDFGFREIHSVRGPARDFLGGDSPVSDVKETIALEIAAEKFGATFFGNGAIPLMVFQLMQGFQNFKSKEEQDEFVESVRRALSGDNRHRALLLPKGMEVSDPIKVENDKAQFLETRKLQRTVIAGAFGVPPHFVGDLERATFNNVEQQDSDFVINVVLPVARSFEAAMERDLLTPRDRANGVIIRFNLDAIQRADFKSRQEGLKIQREAGVISANEWRDHEGMNPITDEDGGDDYIRPLNFSTAGEEPDEPDTDSPI